MTFKLSGVEIVDTFAEAFVMWASRILITAKNRKWCTIAADSLTGFATSVIGCGVEADIEEEVPPEKTPDGRPGVNILAFATSKKKLKTQLTNRIAQTTLTCPTTAAFNGLPEEEADALIDVGGGVRYFGDRYQIAKRFGGVEARRLWRIPVMEGEFLVEQDFGAKKAIAGGNILILGEKEDPTLKATEDAADAIRNVRNVIAPFPGGICRSGSQPGSKYSFMHASTNTAFCPTLRQMVPESKVPQGVTTIYEIPIDALDEKAMKTSMGEGIKAAVKTDEVIQITAANYGGTLGKYEFYLKDCVGDLND